MGEQTPELTLMQQAAAEMRELFTTYVAAGFSEYQACLLLGTWLAQVGRGGSETHE